jgi:hypothetical protein
MTILVVLGIVFLIGVALGAYAWLAPRPATVKTEPLPPIQPWNGNTEWTSEAGDEFAGLSESARCDLVFAVADLRDERSQQLLLHALDDPSDAVALAAAHALARRGCSAAVDEYAEQHPGNRAARIMETLALLD